jgi:hypothetical protein
LAKASTLALVSMMVIVVTVLVQGILVPMEERGALKDWRLLVVNDGIFQAIGVISFGKLLFYLNRVLAEETDAYLSLRMPPQLPPHLRLA